MSLPFIHPVIFVAYLLILALATVGFALRMRQKWDRERTTVREAILQHCNLPQEEDEALDVRFRKRIRALIPCEVYQFAGALTPLNEDDRIWLCILDDLVLFVSSTTGRVIGLSREDFRKLYLVGKTFKGKHALAIEIKGTRSILLVERLVDMVRMLNLFIEEGIVLRYLAEVD